MTSEQYKKISEPFRSESMTKLLKLTNKGLTIFGFAAYPVLLISLFILAPEKLLTAIVVPGSGFVLLTLVRRKINRPRPYVALDIDPIIHKEKKGNSMPSRHVFSMAMIAAIWWLLSPAVCCILMIFSVILAIIRVVAGIHYPSDVVVGALCAIIWAISGCRILL
ncbi:MAG: phosphatase PAP2 family protein [Oscillospiraceae bacterium]|nr:phosphatase PAP2 family protein [Oscillospiraceae bacterium]